MISDRNSLQDNRVAADPTFSADLDGPRHCALVPDRHLAVAEYVVRIANTDSLRDASACADTNLLQRHNHHIAIQKYPITDLEAALAMQQHAVFEVRGLAHLDPPLTECFDRTSTPDQNPASVQHHPVFPGSDL